MWERSTNAMGAALPGAWVLRTQLFTLRTRSCAGSSPAVGAPGLCLSFSCQCQLRQLLRPLQPRRRVLASLAEVCPPAAALLSAQLLLFVCCGAGQGAEGLAEHLEAALSPCSRSSVGSRLAKPTLFCKGRQQALRISLWSRHTVTLWVSHGQGTLVPQATAIQAAQSLPGRAQGSTVRVRNGGTQRPPGTDTGRGCRQCRGGGWRAQG